MLQPSSSTRQRPAEWNANELQEAFEHLRAENAKLRADLHASHADLDHAHERMFQLAAIVESSEDAVIGCSSAGVVTSWNGGAELLFGFDAEETVGKPAGAIAGFHWPDEIRAMNEVLDGRHVPLFEVLRRRKDEAEVHVSVRVSRPFTIGRARWSVHQRHCQGYCRAQAALKL
ncbi:MAG: PAS domain S-box protein [Gemmataceae bacterium]